MFFLAFDVPLAQLDRVIDHDSKGQEFESLRVHHLIEYADVAEWQTRRTQNPFPEREWRFESSHRHHKKPEESFFGFFPIENRLYRLTRIFCQFADYSPIQNGMRSIT
jgi:hypothetical protein